MPAVIVLRSDWLHLTHRELKQGRGFSGETSVNGSAATHYLLNRFQLAISHSVNRPPSAARIVLFPFVGGTESRRAIFVAQLLSAQWETFSNVSLAAVNLFALYSRN